jgi:hypothetical protein
LVGERWTSHFPECWNSVARSIILWQPAVHGHFSVATLCLKALFDALLIVACRNSGF